MSSPTPLYPVRVHEKTPGRPRALVAGFEFEQSAFRGTSFYARALLRALSELGLETLLLTSAAASSEGLLERLSILRQLTEPGASPKWRRRTWFARDLLWPVRARLVALDPTDDVLDRVDYLRWVDGCLNRPSVYDFVRMRSHRRWPAYRVPVGDASVVITPAPIHIRAPRGVPLVTALHDLSPLLRADHPPHDDAREFLCRIRGMERHAAAVLCSTDATRRELVTHFPTLADRCTVLHPPVSLFAEEMALASEPAIERGVLARYRVERHGYMLCVGVIERKKNVRRLLEAYVAVRQQLGMPLLLLGWLGYGSQELEWALSRRGDWIRHFGYVPQLDKIVLMRNARALVFPSLYEGFGLPPLEAMQVGCPVLASNIPAVAEACADAAHLIDCRSIRRIAEGLLEIAGDERLRARLSARGLRRAEELSLRNYREQLGAFLSQFVAVPSAARNTSVALRAADEIFYGGPTSNIPSASGQ
jgi:glycosyltransferase involved in cell wall biosynthesis